MDVPDESASIPTGVVTFLFTDVEGSTRLWAADRDAMAASLRVHDAIIRVAIESRAGYVFTTAGDAFCAAFQRASLAIEAAAAAQDELASADWPGPALRVRMGLHLGEADERGGDYFGPVVNTAARVEAAGHGGQVLLTDAVHAETGADGSDLGEHNLRGLDAPVRIWQLGHGAYPRVRTGLRAPSLPNPPTRLVGRDALVHDVRLRLRGSRLVTLTGAGGCGKTRVAIAVAEKELPEWAEGVWFVDLAKLSEAHEVAAEVAQLVGVEVRAETAAADVARFLAPRQALLVLDNCEHLVDACAELAEQLLARDGPASVLATSREWLDIDGEHIVNVPSLPVGDVDSSAVELFLERARAANPEREIGDVGAAVGVCRHLDGLPLAIELAAARTTILPLQDLLAGLEDRFRLLSGGRRRQRHRTLEATIDWSYDLLDDVEQRVFRGLGVFVGSFDLDAVASVAGLTKQDATDVVEALLVKSIVQASELPGRFHLLETLKAYAEDRLVDAGAAVAVREAHFEHFGGRVGPADPFASSTIEFWDLHDPDIGNLLAAAYHGAATGRWSELAHVLAALGGLLYDGPRGVALLAALDTCADRLEARQLADQVEWFKIPIQVYAARWSDMIESCHRLDHSPNRVVRYTTLLHSTLLTFYYQPEKALATIDAAAAVWGEEPLPDLGLAVATCRSYSLASIGDFDAAQREVDRYFDIEAQLRTRWTYVGTLLTAAAAVGWARRDYASIPDEECLERYRFAGRRSESLLAHARDYIPVLAAIAIGDSDAESRLQSYVRIALSGRTPQEENDALILLALHTHQEGDDERAAGLLRTIGLPRTPGGFVVLAELARRLGTRDRPRPRPDAAADVRETIRAECTRRGW